MKGSRTNYYSGFDPKSVEGCTLWLDATDPNANGTTPANGANISNWADKSGQNYAFSQATVGSQPTYSRTGFGNRGSIVFNGSSSYVVSSTFGSVLGGDDKPYSFFSVMRFTDHTNPAVQSLFNVWTGTSTNGFFAVYVDNNGNPNKWQYIRRDAAGLNVSLQSSANISSGVTYLHTQIFKGTTVDGFLNGTQDANFTNASLNTGTLGTTNSIGSIGILYRSTQLYPLNGEVGEILVYTSALSATQRQQIEGYLARKWGIQSSIPATHPYKSIPPVLRPFAPIDISGCTLWLDAADSNVFTFSSGSNVATWNDKSGNGYTGTAQNSPVRTTVDGVPAVTFNGSTQYIDFGDVADLGSNQLNIFVVSKFNTTGNGSVFAKAAYADAIYRYALIRESGSLVPLLQGNTIGQANNAGVADSNTSVRLITETWDRSTITLYQNGTSNFSVGYSNTSTFNSAYNLLIGAYNNGTGGVPPIGGLYFNGSINEILFFFTTLTTAQRQQIEGYLARKWGLQSSLPSTHPYLGGLPALTAGFNPLAFSNCTLWLDGADRLSMTLSGSNVSQWNDKSGLGYHATQATSSQQPTFTTVNSRPGLFFVSASNTNLRNLTHTMNLSNFSVFLVTQQTAEAVVNSAFIDLTPTSGNAWGSANGFSIESGAANVPMKMSINSVNVFIPGTANPAPFGMYEFFRTGTSGIAYSNGIAGTGATLTTAGTNTGYVVGAPYTGGAVSTTNDLDGYIYEVILYTRQLSTSERQQTEGYLAWKWGLQGSLSGNHPYRLIKP